MTHQPPSIEFEEGAWVHLSARQRGFVARKTVVGIEGAYRYRERIIEKHGDNADTSGIELQIRSLEDLLASVGVDIDEVMVRE